MKALHNFFFPHREANQPEIDVFQPIKYGRQLYFRDGYGNSRIV